jgi:membrane protein DedA with SNARE-associated domain
MLHFRRILKNHSKGGENMLGKAIATMGVWGGVSALTYFFVELIKNLSGKYDVVAGSVFLAIVAFLVGIIGTAVIWEQKN